MARIRQQNPKKGIYVQFQEIELRPYDGIRANVTTSRGKSFVNFYLPLIKWQGHDLRVCADLIDALRMVGNFQARVKKIGGNAGWNAHAHEATIYQNDGLLSQKVRYPVYAYHSNPHVQFAAGPDGHIEWLVQGHYFNDDLPSIRAYVAALSALRTAAADIR